MNQKGKIINLWVIYNKLLFIFYKILHIIKQQKGDIVFKTIIDYDFRVYILLYNCL